MSGEQVLYNRPLPGARLNMSHPLSLGLVGCWLLNEQMGLRAMDLSPYGNHGLLVSFPAGGQRTTHGLAFDGADDYVDVGSGASLDFTKAFTIGAWTKYRAAAGGRSIIKKRNAANTSGWLLGIGGLEKVGFWIYTTGWNGSWDFTAKTIDDNWRHIAGVWDGTTMKVFIDGVQDPNTQALSGTIGLGTDFTYIGAEYGPDSYFPGFIGEVCVYNRALSAEDIKALYLSPYAPMGLKMFF